MPTKWDKLGITNRNSGIKGISDNESFDPDANAYNPAKPQEDTYDKMEKELAQKEMSDDQKRVEKLFDF